ncbi:MAG: VOC family protein [Cyclobacteriaceae bacterium]
MEFTQIKETCLYVTDLDQTEAFYHGMLNMPIISKVADRHIFFRTGTSVLLCFIAESTRQEEVLPPHYASGKQHIAFEVPEKEYSKFKELIMEKGILITHEQEWKAQVKSFYFEDPDGHVLEIVPEGMWD